MTKLWCAFAHNVFKVQTCHFDTCVLTYSWSETDIGTSKQISHFIFQNAFSMQRNDFCFFCENCRTIVLPCNCVSFCSYSFFFNFGSGTTTCSIKILMEFSYYISRTASKVHKSLGLSGMTNCAHIFLLKNRHHQDTMIWAKAWVWIMWKIVCKFQIVPVPISTWRRTNR